MTNRTTDARPGTTPAPATLAHRRALLAAAPLLALQAGLGATALGLSGRAHAQAFPGRPVRIMVGASAGGGTDVIARMLADHLTGPWKQPVIVENRPGASNTIAAELTARAPADGLTLLVGTNTAASIAPHLIKLNYDPLKELDPVGLIVSVPNILVVSQQESARTVGELVQAMKARPGVYQYASSGVGSTQHIAGAAFAAQTGTLAIHVPYRGSSQAHLDLVSGQVPMMFDTSSSVTPLIKAGRVRPLAVMSEQRSANFPDVPTLAEAGVTGIEMTTWYGMWVTGNTPASTQQILQASLKEVLSLPVVKNRLTEMGGEPGTMSAVEFATFNQREFARFGTLLKRLDIRIEQ